MQNKAGKLYVVATPIGNLQDMTFRAVQILKQVDRIIAEDTRHSAPLLKHFSIVKPCLSMHEFNERDRVKTLLNYLIQGEMIALISDAGTPLINDPGYHLIKEARGQAIDVIPIPGSCAAVAALSVSGLPTHKFTFEGFLPTKTEARRHKLALLARETRTMIFYESPQRVLSTLQDMADIFGQDRKMVVARELTKLHESILANPVSEIMNYFHSHEKELCGEFVILVQGINEAAIKTIEVVPEHVLDILLHELPLKQAVVLTHRITGESKNAMYELALTKVKSGHRT